MTTLVGIDCATDSRNVGLALGALDGARLRLLEAIAGSPGTPPADTIVGWIAGARRALLAVDAPLGWPAPLGDTLARHRAGEALPEVSAHALFRRLTDDRERIGRQPLDVGADRIARTAHAALALLEALRRRTGHPIPLAWRPDFPHAIAAIEVYPAGTLRAHALPASGYKKAAQRAVRAEIVRGLAPRLHPGSHRGRLLADADVLDACVCVLAADDFLAGRAGGPGPGELERARREGWIWVANARGAR